jgi:hypothetical protein
MGSSWLSTASAPAEPDEHGEGQSRLMHELERDLLGVD